MNGERKKPGIGFWATVVVSALVLYPLSYGPASWLAWRVVPGSKRMFELYRTTYWPVDQTAAHFNGGINLQLWYFALWVKPPPDEDQLLIPAVTPGE
jgi:hypothetical protein